MPTYDFLCSNPVEQHRFDDIVPHDAPAPDCPTCGMPSVKVPAFRGAVSGGGTPKFYPDRY